MGRVAGSICNAFMAYPQLKDDCLALSPAISFKVKRCLLQAGFPLNPSAENIKQLTKNIRESVGRVLLSYETTPHLVSKVEEEIENAVRQALQQPA